MRENRRIWTVIATSSAVCLVLPFLASLVLPDVPDDGSIRVLEAVIIAGLLALIGLPLVSGVAGYCLFASRAPRRALGLLVLILAMTTALSLGIALASPGSGPVDLSAILEIVLALLLLVALGALVGYAVGTVREGRT